MFSQFESLERRQLFAVTASFANGTVSVFGDAQNNAITMSRDAAGKILVNGGAVAVQGGTPTVANTALIQVFGLGGNDTVTLDESNGALPKANLFGGDGNDVLTGGSGGDLLFGQAGNDTLLGKGGIDLLFGGAGNDVLTGGDADDQVFGEADNDRMIWNPGDDTDLNEGGAGVDTVEVNGGNGAEEFTATPNGTRVRFDRITPAPFSIDIGTSEGLVVNMNGGDDKFTGANGLATLIQLTVDGGTGNDAITGGDGADFLLGGDGGDTIFGGRGNDTALMGAGDDVFVWNPGDGSDVIEGQDGTDTMQFNGANIAEKIDLSANGGRLRFTRDVAAITMDTNDVEHVSFKALGGADRVTAGDLSATDVTALDIDLGASAGGGDGAADQVIVSGTIKKDVVQVAGSGSSYAVLGLATAVTVTNSEGAADQLTVNLLDADDTLDASGLPAGATGLTVDGGTGNDLIVGSQGADMILGGDGMDQVTAGRGNDVVLLGAGDDGFVWNPGDGSDIVEGQDGADAMRFFGANVAENIDISANGSRVRFSRDVASIVMDLNGVERVDFRALGGADNVNVNDLTGTDLTVVNLDMGAADGATDSVLVNGTNGDDTFGATSNGAGAQVFGLHTAVNIAGQEQTDRLTLGGLAGADNINASGLVAGTVQLSVNGGAGDDFIIGSAGADVLTGQQGNDVVLAGLGDDVMVWNPGDGSDTLEGQDGFDAMAFNGANIAENINIAANGSRVRFTRDIANIVMDVNGTEQITFNALGGADRVTVGDLSGTDVTDVLVNLGATLNSTTGDGAADQVTVEGTSGDDVILVAGDAGSAQVIGLAATVSITGAEPANDSLVVRALGGNDVVQASGLTFNTTQLIVDAGEGDDIVIGGGGNDVLDGGLGDDVLIGGPGLDTLLNGEVVIQD